MHSYLFYFFITNCLLFIYLFGVLHYTSSQVSDIFMKDCWKGGGNGYIQLVNVLYHKSLTNSKQLPAFPHEVKSRFKLRSQRLEASVWPPFLIAKESHLLEG